MPRPSFLPRGIALVLGALVVWASFAAAGEDPPKPPAPPPPKAEPAPTPPNPFPPPEREGRREGRETMWPAPTAADWKKPVLLTWQRTWDDAVAVAKETGKPILVCINMDGEIASEHYAGVRYRQPELAELYEPYVTVVASVYRHNPRDFDDEGKRIPCPRFGGVTCGEHIAIEPTIFEKFCKNQRIAPRHIMVEVKDDGTFAEVYDVYYRNDTASVFQAIKDGIALRTVPTKPPVVRGDRPIAERVASRDVRDRVAVEQAYASGDRALRGRLLDAALANGQAAPLDLLRLGVFGLDADLAKSARAALAKVDSPDATGLVADALRVPMDPAERDALIAALKRLGGSNVLARWLSVVHSGLAGRSATVDPAKWSRGGGTGPTETLVLEGLDLSTYVEAKARLAQERPDDPQVRLDLAEATLRLAFEGQDGVPFGSRRARQFQRALLDDARAAALKAESLGAYGWRVNSIVALAAHYAGDDAVAYPRATEAVKSIPPGDASWVSMAVLTIFVEARWKDIKKAVKEKLDFPPEWLTDVHAAQSVLLRHPLGTAEQALWHYDLLDWLGAYDQADRVLAEAIGRFQGSAALHERFRADAAKRRGMDGMEKAYEALAKANPDSATIAAFAGIASVAAAEQHRRRADTAASLAAYGRAIERYERAIALDGSWKDEGDKAVALALAGRARTAYEAGDDDAALKDVLASLARSPGAAGTPDAMNITPGETAKMLRERLVAGRKDDAVRALRAALDALDQDLLRDRE